MFLTKNFYIYFAIIVIVIACGYVMQPLLIIGCFMAVALLLATIADILLLYRNGKLTAWRTMEPTFSNGDNNKVHIDVESTYSFNVYFDLIDELPPQFQKRDFLIKGDIAPDEDWETDYELCPKERGVYQFGHLRVFAMTRLKLVKRRFTEDEPEEVKVYPAYKRLQEYSLATSSRETGDKKNRQVGNATEFAQIKDYVQGDDYRKINWKASARRHQLMVNVYEDEKSQQIFSLIDKGRVMQQSFNGMTLLDHSINACLALSHVALKKGDNVGLATFDNLPGAFLPATRNNTQLQKIMDALYNLDTAFMESNFELLCTTLNRLVTKRSLIIIYTNFFSIGALKRQLPYLFQISHRHRLLMVFFEDNEQNVYVNSAVKDEEDYFRHVVAERYVNERRSMITLLRQHGILSLLTEPEHLNVSLINKYLEIKTQNLF